MGARPPPSEKNLEKISPLLKSEFPSKPLLVINNYWQIIVVWTVCKRGRGYPNLQGYPCRILQKRLYNNTWVSFFIHLHSKAYKGVELRALIPPPNQWNVWFPRGFWAQQMLSPPPPLTNSWVRPWSFSFLNLNILVE